MKRIALAATILFAGTSFSPAAELVDFSRIRCETKGIDVLILEKLPTMKFENGDLFAQHLDARSISKIETLKSEKNTLVCRVTIDVGYGANRKNMRGTWTVKQYQDGRISETWKPNY